MNTNVKKLTTAAALLAICIVSQFFKNTSVFITGPIINTCLIICVLSCGLPWAILLSVVTPVTAFLITGAPVMKAIPAIMPFIMAGNVLLALGVWFFAGKKKTSVKVLVAGEKAGSLTEEGAKLLDVSGELGAGIPLCPPEGDAGTGMVATNSVAVRTGNVSAGTSVFAMVVMEHALKAVHEEIDVVTTPVGDDVAMVHCNNCTSDINAWANIFREYSEAMGIEVDTNKLYTTLFEAALKGAPDCGGIMGYNYFSGEPVTGFEEGRPVILRSVNADFSFANFMRHNLYSAVSTLKYGLDILLKDEGIEFDKLYGHGGYFKTKEVGQRIMSAATGGPITVMETAGEGGAWGIAVLALFESFADKMTLPEFLNDVIFKGEEGYTVMASPEEVEGFEKYMEAFKKCIPVERAAVENI